VNRLHALAALLLLALLCAVPGHAENLKLLVSVERQNIVAPGPVRATLHFHNSGPETIWLYRPVRSRMPGDRLGMVEAGSAGLAPHETYGGSRLAVRLAPQSGPKGAAGSGFAMAPDAFPYPRLVRLAPGADYQERVNIHVEPAGQSAQPVWGAYSFSVAYSASYSNGDVLARDVRANLWHGQATSNTVMLNLQPPAAQGSITGTVLDSVGRTYGEALVTLSDDNEDSLDQLFTNDDGEFSFTHLPPGRYWLTVRQPFSNHDTSVFRHVDLSRSGLPEPVDIMMLPVQADNPEHVLHKPVLFHIVDTKGLPLANVKLAILYAAGNVLESRKAQTGDDGFTAISLIPGTNLVTLETAGCKKEDRQADVAPGRGVDGFQFVFECVRK
jgi:Carboxypeptidase regulatory-like domain